jgi:3-oxoacyl-[acyl-carrier protein] reductase
LRGAPARDSILLVAMAEQQRLLGWRFLITGASRGLGRGVAQSLLDEGATVLALARTELDLLSLQASQPVPSGRLLTQVGSMDEPADLQQALRQLEEQVGGCDVLVANAAVYGPRLPFHQAPAQSWEEAVLTNLLGLSRSCRACIPALAASGRGQILVMGSAIGHGQGVDSSAYAASKAMAWSLVKCLSLELAPMGIAVNELIPGPVLTAMNPHSGPAGFVRLPDDPIFSNFMAWLCVGSGVQPPSGQSFSLRPSP